MQEDTVAVENNRTAAVGRTKKKDPSETVTVCKKSLVMPLNTLTLDVDDVLFYKENKESYKGKKSPYLIYLSTEFKRAVRKRSRSRRIKWISIAGISLIGIILLLYICSLIFFK